MIWNYITFDPAHLMLMLFIGSLIGGMICGILYMSFEFRDKKLNRIMCLSVVLVSIILFIVGMIIISSRETISTNTDNINAQARNLVRIINTAQNEYAKTGAYPTGYGELLAVNPSLPTRTSIVYGGNNKNAVVRSNLPLQLGIAGEGLSISIKTSTNLSAGTVEKTVCINKNKFYNTSGKNLCSNVYAQTVRINKRIKTPPPASNKLTVYCIISGVDNVKRKVVTTANDCKALGGKLVSIAQPIK